MPITGDIEVDLKSWLHGQGYDPVCVLAHRRSDGVPIALVYDEFHKHLISHELLQVAVAIAEEHKDMEP